MMPSEIDLAFFLPVVLAVYWALPRRAALQNAVLLGASYVFYLTWSPRLLWVLLLSTAVDYTAGRILEGDQSPRLRRWTLAASVTFNLGLLGWFKYQGFFAGELDRLLSALGLGAPVPVLHLALPVGISFYTFQKIAYVLDVYHGRRAACRSPLTFAVFVAFFPQLIAGPIVRADDLVPQYEAARRFDVDRLASAAAIFLLGFVKKAYLADYLGANLVDPIFAAPARYSVAAHWLGVVGYAAQVFFDFSGYSEMAIGLGRAFGIELPVNFNYPFLSRSLAEMWRRWHITLNTFLFEYVYGPLTTGESWLRGRLDVGFVIVFLLSGIWHGPAWTFVTWGLLHGIGLVVHRRWDEWYRGLCRRDRTWVAVRKGARYSLAAWAATQLYFVLTIVPFRAPSLAAAAAYARGLVSSPGTLRLPDGPTLALRPLHLLLCGGFLVGYHLLELERGRPWRDRFFALPPFARGLVYGGVIALLFVLMPESSGSFVYAQF